MLSEEGRRRTVPGLHATTADLPTRAVVPSRLTRFAAVLVLASALMVAVLGAVHHGSSGAGPSDRAVTAALQSGWRPGSFAYAVDGLVTLVPILVTVAVLAVVSLLTGQRRLAVVALLGPFAVAGATTVLKPLVGRTIHGDNLSFPSGHTGYATSIGVVLGLLLVGLARGVRPVPAGALLLVPPAAVGCFMAADQIVIEAHYPSDTFGGFGTALAVVLTLALVLDRVLDRWASARSSRPPAARPASVRSRTRHAERGVRKCTLAGFASPR